MKNFLMVVVKFLVLLLILGLGFGAGYLFKNHESIVVEKIFIPKLSQAIETNSVNFKNELFVDSEDDETAENAIHFIDFKYHSDMEDVKVTVNKINLYASGLTHCIFDGINNDEYELRCVEGENAKFLNYFLDLEISYKEEGVTKTRKEVGMVVFVKSSKVVDVLGWRILRYYSVDV